MPTRPATAQPLAVVPEDALPVLRLTTPKDPGERVLLFTIDDKEYTVVKHPSASVGLKLMHLAATKGDAIASDWLLTEMLGEEGYKALMEYRGLTREQLEQVVKVCNDLVMGDLETPKE